MKKVNIYIEVEYHGQGFGGRGKYYAIIETFTSTNEPATMSILGGLTGTTKNRLYMTAINRSLERLNTSCDIDIYSRSAYAMEMMQQEQFLQWQQSGWIRRDSQPVKNRDLWERYIELKKNHLIHAETVKVHSYTSYQITTLFRANVEMKPDEGGNTNV